MIGGKLAKHTCHMVYQKEPNNQFVDQHYTIFENIMFDLEQKKIQNWKEKSDEHCNFYF